MWTDDCLSCDLDVTEIDKVLCCYIAALLWYSVFWDSSQHRKCSGWGNVTISICLDLSWYRWQPLSLYDVMISGCSVFYLLLNKRFLSFLENKSNIFIPSSNRKKCFATYLKQSLPSFFLNFCITKIDSYNCWTTPFCW